MENIIKLLDDVKAKLGVTSDYALAKSLGLPKQRICNYYKGERAPDEFACLKIAEALGKPLDTVIATVKAASEKDDTRREAWENYMKRLGGIAASFLITLFVTVTTGVTLTPGNASAATISSGHSLYYVNC
jgi:transcriptional regulator with XRE-family HTH domain